jgi:hypothetical protein
MGEVRIAYRFLVGKTEGKWPLGRPRHREEDIKMDLKEVECKDVELIQLAHVGDRWQGLLNAVKDLRCP